MTVNASQINVTLLALCKHALLIEESVTMKQERELRDGFKEILQVAIADCEVALNPHTDVELAFIRSIAERDSQDVFDTLMPRVVEIGVRHGWNNESAVEVVRLICDIVKETRMQMGTAVQEMMEKGLL